MSGPSLSPRVRRIVTLVLAVPACYLAYVAGLALGPNNGTFTPPHHQANNRLTGWP